MKSFMMMTEIDVADYFGIAEALGIIGPLFGFYTFSRIQKQHPSIDRETRVLESHICN
jgi:hypothetical protein